MSKIPTAVEWLFDQIPLEWTIKRSAFEALQQAKEMEREQLFLASNISAKDAYKAGQKSMYCGCYEYDGCTTYEEWLYEQFKKKEVTNESKFVKNWKSNL